MTRALIRRAVRILDHVGVAAHGGPEGHIGDETLYEPIDGRPSEPMTIDLRELTPQHYAPEVRVAVLIPTASHRLGDLPRPDESVPYDYVTLRRSTWAEKVWLELERWAEPNTCGEAGCHDPEHRGREISRGRWLHVVQPRWRMFP